MVELDSGSSVIPDDSFGFSSCSWGIEHIKRMICWHDNWTRLVSSLLDLMKIKLIRFERLPSDEIVSVKDDFWQFFLIRHSQSLINNAFVVDDSWWLFSCICTQNNFRLTILNTIGQLVCCKSSKNDDMGGSNSRTSMNGNERFNGHGHVDNDSISWHYLELSLHSPSQSFTSLMELPVGDLTPLNKQDLYLIGDWALMPKSNLIRPINKMPVDALLWDVDFAIRIPFIEI